MNREDEQSAHIYASGLVIRDLPARMSSWRAERTLPEYLKHHGIVAIADIDTRRLTRILREKGAQSGAIMAGHIDEQAAIAKARAFPGLGGMDLVKVVTTANPYAWTQGRWVLGEGHRQPAEALFHVVAYD